MWNKLLSNFKRTFSYSYWNIYKALKFIFYPPKSPKRRHILAHHAQPQENTSPKYPIPLSTYHANKNKGGKRTRRSHPKKSRRIQERKSATPEKTRSREKERESELQRCLRRPDGRTHRTREREKERNEREKRGKGESSREPTKRRENFLKILSEGLIAIIIVEWALECSRRAALLSLFLSVLLFRCCCRCWLVILREERAPCFVIVWFGILLGIKIRFGGAEGGGSGARNEVLSEIFMLKKGMISVVVTGKWRFYCVIFLFVIYLREKMSTVVILSNFTYSIHFLPCCIYFF